MAREARTPEGVWRALVRATAKESPPQGVCCSQTKVLLLSLPGGKSGLLSASSPGIGKAKQKLGFFLPSPPPLFSVLTQSLWKGPFLRIAFLSCLWARAESLSPLCPVAGVSLRYSPRFIDNLVSGSTASPNVPLLPDPGWERGVCTRDSWILMGSIFTFSVERNQPFRKRGTGLRLNENPQKKIGKSHSWNPVSVLSKDEDSWPLSLTAAEFSFRSAQFAFDPLQVQSPADLRNGKPANAP